MSCCNENSVHRLLGQHRTASAGRRAAPARTAVIAEHTVTSEPAQDSAAYGGSQQPKDTVKPDDFALPSNAHAQVRPRDSDPTADPLLDLLGFSPAKPKPALRKTTSVAGQALASNSAALNASDASLPSIAAYGLPPSQSALQHTLPAAQGAYITSSQAQPAAAQQGSAAGDIVTALPSTSAMAMPVASSQVHLLPSFLPSLPVAAAASAAPLSQLTPTSSDMLSQQQHQLVEARQECASLRQQLKVNLLLTYKPANTHSSTILDVPQLNVMLPNT